ncbi:ribosomal protein S5 domain 2-type protein [Hyaloraphidium curvatum]|nr:ribosomal protein S5 domain 2-type protein [Hyaloraphidium curvatum]
MEDRKDLISLEGLRLDGRRPKELRRLSARTGVLPRADGSAYVQMGNTRCLCTVYGPKERDRRREGQGAASSSTENRSGPAGGPASLLEAQTGAEDGASMPSVGGGAQITVDFHAPTFAQSSGQRGGAAGRANRGRDRRTVEIAATLRKTVEPIIIASAFPRSEIRISCQMIQVDGGTLACAVNAATLAIIDAGIPVTDYVCAVTVGAARLPKGFLGTASGAPAPDAMPGYLSDHEILLDLNSLEENSHQCASITLATLAKRNQSKAVTLLSENKFHLEALEAMLDTAADGCAVVQKVLEAEVKRTLEARLGGAQHSLEEAQAASGVTIDLNAFRSGART